MALRNFGNTLLHVSYIAGAIWLGAHELALHNITDSDVYKGPTESPAPIPLNSPVVPSIQPLQQSASTSTIFDAPTITTTTTKYITVTRDDDPTSVPIFHERSSRNPYANNSFVLGAIPYVVPFFKSSYGQALTHILSSLSGHPITKAIYQATASLISFLLYLWSILPGGKQGLNTLVLALSLYVLQFANVWDPLARWFSKFLGRRDNKSPPSHGSAPFPAPSPPSSGRPAADNNDSLPGSPKLPNNTSSTGTQTIPGNTQSAGTQTTGLVTEGERSCLNKVARLQGELINLRSELAQANTNIGTRDVIISDRDITIDRYKNEVQSLERDLSQASHNLRHRLAQISDLQNASKSNDQDHRCEIDRLQAQIDAAASSSQTENDKIKRVQEAHEAQIRDLQTSHGSTVQSLESEVQSLQAENDGLRHNNERLQKENNALSQQSEGSSGTDENANSAEERQRLEGQVRDLREEVQSLTAAHEEQQKLSLEAQSEQETVLTDWRNKVKALESTNTGLTQQNEALLERERAAKQTEEKAKAEVEALQTQVGSLEHSLSLSRAGDKAAAGLQQEIADARKREEARVNELQQRLSQAEAARDTAVRQQQDDATTAQRMRESEEQLTRRISSLEQDLLQARSAHAADMKTANDDKIKLQHEFSEIQKTNEEMLKQGQELLESNKAMLEQGRDLQTVRDQYADLNERYKREGDALHLAHESLKQAYDQQAQKNADEKSVLEAQAQKRLQYEKQNCEGLRKSVKELQAKVNHREEENSQARAEISALKQEVKMLREANDNLIDTNTSLAEQDVLKQWADMSAADADQNTPNAQVPPQHQHEDINPTVQPTPFTNPPVFPPPRSTDTTPSNSPAFSTGVRKILTARGPRSKSPKKTTHGESKDPAQEILNWCNDIPADNTTSGLPNRPTETPRSTPGQSPMRPIFDLLPSRPSGPNIFETVNAPTRQVITDFTNGALSNAPVLQPNHNFATGAVGHAQNPVAPGTVLDPALGGIAPSGIPGTTSPRTLTRDEEREIDKAKQLEVRQQLEHEARKKESEEIYKKILRDELGNFEGEYEGDDPPDAAQTSATDGNGDTDMAGTPSCRLVVGSRQEHDYLRSMPDNENGRHDALYRRHNYRDPDTLDEFESPIYYSDLVQGSDAEISFLHSTMPANEDGRFDDLYRGNNYKIPDAWDEFDNPVWH